METNDAEIDAMAVLYRTLAALSPEARERVLEWADARIRAEEIARKESQLARPDVDMGSSR